MQPWEVTVLAKVHVMKMLFSKKVRETSWTSEVTVCVCVCVCVCVVDRGRGVTLDISQPMKPH